MTAACCLSSIVEGRLEQMDPELMQILKHLVIVQNVELYRPAVTERAQYCCEYCHYRKSASNTVLEIDHIHPKAAGGQTSLENLAHPCPRCNGRKRDKIVGFDPETKEQVRLFNPRLDQWETHVSLEPTTGGINGLTAIGRTTTQELAFNAPRAVTNRLLLIKSGIFLHSST